MSGDARRLSLCKQLAERKRKLAPIEDEVKRLEDELRQIALSRGAGFSERLDDGAVVTVTAGSEPKLKGLLPVLSAEAFLTLPDRSQKKLIDDGVVAMTEQWTQARKPSVRVEL